MQDPSAKNIMESILNSTTQLHYIMRENKTEDFLEIIENNKGILYKVANSYCRNNEDRKDLIQEISVQLWKSYESYNANFKHSTWIYRISLNVAISFYRKETSRQRISNDLTPEIFNFTTNEIEHKNESDLLVLNQVIMGLNDLNKALILLYLEEKSYQEISEIIGITETNVATKIGRIKRKLRTEFTKIKSL